MKNLSWQQAEARAKTLIASYKAQDYASLAIRLTSSKPVELSKETISEKPRIIVSSWGQKEPDARLAILVESRRKDFSWINQARLCPWKKRISGVMGISVFISQFYVLSVCKFFRTFGIQESEFRSQN